MEASFKYFTINNYTHFTYNFIHLKLLMERPELLLRKLQVSPDGMRAHICKVSTRLKFNPSQQLFTLKNAVLFTLQVSVCLSLLFFKLKFTYSVSIVVYYLTFEIKRCIPLRRSLGCSFSGCIINLGV